VVWKCGVEAACCRSVAALESGEEVMMGMETTRQPRYTAFPCTITLDELSIMTGHCVRVCGKLRNCMRTA